MRRALVILWAALAGWSAAVRVARLVREAPAAGRLAADRAAMESGDPALHLYLLSVRGLLRPGEGAAVWIDDTAREDEFTAFRARYELFPFRVEVFPGRRRGAPPKGFAVVGAYRRGEPGGEVARR